MKFLPYNPEQAYLLPPRVADVLGKEHLCFFLRRVVDRLDLNSFEEGYEDEGRPAYAPELLVAVWLYAYALGVTSSRRLEQRVREDLAFRYLAAGATPDFWTLNQFRRQPVGRSTICSRSGGVWRARRGGTPGACSDRFDPAWRRTPPGWRRRSNPSALAASLQCRRSQPEASGLELKKEEMTRLQERLAEIPSRLEQLKSPGSDTFPGERDRRGFTLGYTVDVAVSEESDRRAACDTGGHRQCFALVEAVERRCGEMPQKVSADSGFFSVKNLEALTASGIDAYVPDSNMAHALNRGGRVRHRTRHPEHRRMRQKLRSP